MVIENEETSSLTQNGTFDRIEISKGKESLKKKKGYSSDEVKAYLKKCINE